MFVERAGELGERGGERGEVLVAVDALLDAFAVAGGADVAQQRGSADVGQVGRPAGDEEEAGAAVAERVDAEDAAWRSQAFHREQTQGPSGPEHRGDHGGAAVNVRFAAVGASGGGRGACVAQPIVQERVRILIGHHAGEHVRAAVAPPQGHSPEVEVARGRRVVRVHDPLEEPLVVAVSAAKRHLGQGRTRSDVRSLQAGGILTAAAAAVARQPVGRLTAAVRERGGEHAAAFVENGVDEVGRLVPVGPQAAQHPPGEGVELSEFDQGLRPLLRRDRQQVGHTVLCAEHQSVGVKGDRRGVEQVGGTGESAALGCGIESVACAGADLAGPCEAVLPRVGWAVAGGAEVGQEELVLGAGEGPRQSPQQHPAAAVLAQAGGTVAGAAAAEGPCGRPLELAAARRYVDGEGVVGVERHGAQHLGSNACGLVQRLGLWLGEPQQHVVDAGGGQPDMVQEALVGRAQAARVTADPAVQGLAG